MCSELRCMWTRESQGRVVQKDKDKDKDKNKDKMLGLFTKNTFYIHAT